MSANRQHQSLRNDLGDGRLEQIALAEILFPATMPL
jgi:hypothetical protein